MQNNEKQDFILVIRPDKLDENLLFQLKNHTNKLITYYFDSITNFPKKSKLIKYFDKVYAAQKKLFGNPYINCTANKIKFEGQ